jgi:hypothetical protein
VELTAADADERERRRLQRLLLDGRRTAVRARPPQPDPGREEVPLPRVRADRVAEARLVAAPLQPIRARLLSIRPPGREVRRRRELVINERAVTDDRAKNPKPARTKRLDKTLQGFRRDQSFGSQGFLP